MDSRPEAGKSEPTIEPVSSQGKPACRRTFFPESPRLTFFPRCVKYERKVFSKMKAFFKSMLAVLAVATAFILGFNFGKSKEKAKIPEFQKD